MHTTNTIVFKAGQLKYDLDTISKKKGKSLSQIIREVLQEYVKVEKQKESKKNNFLSRFRGTEKMSEEEMIKFTEYLRNSTKLKERDF
jgi:metal-responsive CopG/Arc/MetJ family transcriptional regulator